MEPTLILYDLDGTLVDSDHHIDNRFKQYLFRTVGIHLPGLTWEEFETLHAPMHAAHGSSIAGWKEHLGFDDDWTHNRFREVAPELAEEVISHIKPDPVVLDELEWQRSKGFQLAVLTHSDDVYAEKVMQHAELLRIIPQANVFGMSRVKSLKTDRDGKPYHTVLDALGARNKRRAMVENTQANLDMAHETGFITHLTNVDKPAEMAFTDHHHHHIHQTLHALRKLAR